MHTSSQDNSITTSTCYIDRPDCLHQQHYYNYNLASQESNSFHACMPCSQVVTITMQSVFKVLWTWKNMCVFCIVGMYFIVMWVCIKSIAYYNAAAYWDPPGCSELECPFVLFSFGQGTLLILCTSVSSGKNLVRKMFCSTCYYFCGDINTKTMRLSWDLDGYTR